MRTLHLPIKRKWFNMILEKTKREEYREIKQHWISRLIDFENEIEADVWRELLHDLKNPFEHHNSVNDLMNYFNCSFKKFDYVCFTNGYGKDSEQITIKCNGIRIDKAKPEWSNGAVGYFFVIELGND